MGKITKLWIAIIFVVWTVSVNAQQQCATLCHSGDAIRVINPNAINGHIKHGDILLSTDCDYEAPEDACRTLSAPKFDFSESYPLGLDYVAYNLLGEVLQKGLTSREMQINLPKAQILLIKVEGYQTTKFYIQ